MRTISKPGIYTLSEAEYFADPCPEPSLTQSIAKLLIHSSPMHAMAAHPRLNVNWAPKHADHFDLGHLVHRLVLGAGADIEVIDADSWRTNAAKALRDAARQAGRTPVLALQYERGVMMEAELRQQAGHLFESCKTEQTVIWRDSKIWCRTKIDAMTTNGQVTVDYKTTARVIPVERLDFKAIADGWDLQAAVHEAALNAVAPECAGHRSHYYVLQEAEPPYAVHVTAAEEGFLHNGRQKWTRAKAIWSACLMDNKWPGPANDVHVLHVPAFAFYSSDEDEAEGVDS